MGGERRLRPPWAERRQESPSPRRAAWSATLAWRAPLEARFPFRSPEAIERAQRRRLRATVAHAYEHVPYYRETMRRLGLTPADIARAEDIARLPLIERDQLQRDPEYFVSQAWPPDALPAAAQRREHRRADHDLPAPRRPVRGRGLSRADRGRRSRGGAGGARRLRRGADRAARTRAERRHEFDRRTLIPRPSRLTRRASRCFCPPAEMVEELNDFDPDVIATYGSYLEALFRYLLESGASLRARRSSSTPPTRCRSRRGG